MCRQQHQLPNVASPRGVISAGCCAGRRRVGCGGGARGCRCLGALKPLLQLRIGRVQLQAWKWGECWREEGEHLQAPLQLRIGRVRLQAWMVEVGDCEDGQS